MAEDVYGDKYAINADREGTVDIKADAANKIIGAVYAKDKETNVNIQSLNANATTANYIASATVIHRAGDLDKSKDETMKNLKVISSLYAQGGAEINLSGKNTILTYANKDDDTTAERSVWAYDKGKINVDGYTYISTNEYDESPNSMDVAVAAGTATNLTEDSFKNYPAGDDNLAKVNINYANDGDIMSYIKGDILAAYGGVVNITNSNPDITTYADGEETALDGINIHGNLLAGNKGVLNVNIGNGGSLTGRADDYGDASTEHVNFYDPAFSSDILYGGEVNLTMGEGSRWDVTDQSWITNIITSDKEETADSNHVINLVLDDPNDRNENAHALTVRNFKGNATFNMSLDKDRNISDMLYIKHAEGDYIVNVVDAVNYEAMYAPIEEGGEEIFNGLRFATVGAGSTASFRAITYDKGFNNVEYQVASDSYNGNDENIYYNGKDLENGNGKPGDALVNDLFGEGNSSGYENATNEIMTLESVQDNEENSAETDGPDSVTDAEEHTNFKLVGVKETFPSDAGKTMLNMSRANYSNAIYMDRLNKRLGEARYINDDGYVSAMTELAKKTPSAARTPCTNWAMTNVRSATTANAA